jgi:hypothetical protein
MAKQQNQLKQGLIGKEKSAPTGRKKTSTSSNNDVGANSGRGCCGRFCGEFSLEFFGEKDANGRTLDLVASFCTERTIVASLVKFVIWGIVLYTYVVGWLRSRPDLDFYLAYLTNWSLTYAAIYMTLSLLNTWCCNVLSILRATWIMYSVASVHQVAVTLLFWLVEYDPDKNVIDYYTVMAHGGVAVLVLFEGILVNRVPVRLKHYLFNFVLASLYLGWTIIQTLVLRYNPNAGDDDDDVAIYDVIRWKNNPTQAGIVAALVLFVFLPIDQLLIWGISLCCRRYKPEDNDGRTYGDMGIMQVEIQPTKGRGGGAGGSGGRGEV